jgi:hypothetical protein
VHNGAASASSSATATAAQVSGQWPRLLFLLRDRVLHCPQQLDASSTSTASSSAIGSDTTVSGSALGPILQLLQQRERSGVLLAAADEGLCQEVRNGLSYAHDCIEVVFYAHKCKTKHAHAYIYA